MSRIMKPDCSLLSWLIDRKEDPVWKMVIWNSWYRGNLCRDTLQHTTGLMREWLISRFLYLCWYGWWLIGCSIFEILSSIACSILQNIMLKSFFVCRSTYWWNLTLMINCFRFIAAVYMMIYVEFQRPSMRQDSLEMDWSSEEDITSCLTQWKTLPTGIAY